MENKHDKCKDSAGFKQPGHIKCPICGLEMKLKECFIPREEMHFALHAEACSEWECVCGFAAFVGLSSRKFYPYKKIILK